MTDSQKYPNINQRRVETNGISLNIAEQGEGPLVLMLHGFRNHGIPGVTNSALLQRLVTMRWHQT